LPNGKSLARLRDAALYITRLPKAEHDTQEWQAAMEALLLVVEGDGPTYRRDASAEPSRRASVG
jgi:hypothetical protein